MKLYVGNLGSRTTASELRALISAFGGVATSQIALAHPGGPSKRYGFVEVPDEAEARTAIAALDGSDFHGEPLVVRELADKGTSLFRRK